MINFGIGFVAGRYNVCDIINYYHKDIVEQAKDLEVHFTFYILYDLLYQDNKREGFYNIDGSTYKHNNITIKYITPEDINEDRKILINRHNFNKNDVDLFLGYGHAKCRNTVMYYALNDHIDYLLFWDDDEYPIAVFQNNDKTLSWKKQNNVMEHIKNIENANITIGYHCGYVSPIPNIDLEQKIVEEIHIKNFIEAISNELVTWESIRDKYNNTNGVTYALKENLKRGARVMENVSESNGVAGSTLCLNMRQLDYIPAFYAAENSRRRRYFLFKPTWQIRF